MNGEGAVERANDRLMAGTAELMEPVTNVLPGKHVDAAIVQALTENADRTGTEQGRMRDEIGDPNRVEGYNETAVPIAGRLAGDAVDNAILGSVHLPAGRAGVAQALQGKLRGDLLRGATKVGDGGVSAVARAMQKHAARPGSAFSSLTGDLLSRNAAGRALADEILGNTATTFTQRTTGRFGEVLDVIAPDGRGMRFDAGDQFIGLLEPPR